MQYKRKTSTAVTLILLTLVFVCSVCLSFFTLTERFSSFVTAAAAVYAVLAAMLLFELRPTDTRRLTLIAVMTSLSVAGRAAFAFVPGFKPVTAVVVIAAIYLGAEAGFLTGALSALVSNFIFGQGPWTPFQMLAWGLIGLFAGIMAGALKKSRFLLSLYGAAAGVLYSLLMDLWSVLWFNGGFSLSLYGAALISALPFTAVYAVSNISFLATLAVPIGKKLDRVTEKYGIS